MTLTNVVITNNSAIHSGGGIYNNSDLTVINSTISNNSAEAYGGGVRNDVNLTLMNSRVEANSSSQGGGIYNDVFATMAITNSVISDNLGSSGGGINNAGTATVTGSTLKANSSLYGGGIHTTKSLTLTNSTLFENQASTDGGGINNIIGTLTVMNSTFSGNTAASGGGIYDSYGSPTITNNILWGNTGGELVIASSAIVTYSIVQGGYDGTGNLNTDPLLGALANNGGATQTMALGAGSPAINTGNNSTCAVAPVNNLDQRGFSRPEGSACEIGAYEVDIPIVASIKRSAQNPTAASVVEFQVTFSESVTGVDNTSPFDDFLLTATGVIGAAITNVTGSGDNYTVTVNTGSSEGIIRLDIVDNDTIQDASNNLLGGTGEGNGDFNTGEFYSIQKLAKNLSQPVLLSPRSTYPINTTPMFSWSNVANADHYEIQFATDSAFTQDVSSEFPDTTTFTFGSPLLDGKYYWRVRAYNILGQTGGWSSARSFSIDRLPPSPPLLKLPANQATVRGVPTFRWSAAMGGVQYQFEIDNDLDFASPVFSAIQRTMTRRPPGVLRGTYFWHVRVQDAAGNWSEWSETFRVEILPRH